jgi:hypothetical protein
VDSRHKGRWQWHCEILMGSLIPLQIYSIHNSILSMSYFLYLDILIPTNYISPILVWGVPICTGEEHDCILECILPVLELEWSSSYPLCSKNGHCPYWDRYGHYHTHHDCSCMDTAHTGMGTICSSLGTSIGVPVLKNEALPITN